MSIHIPDDNEFINKAINKITVKNNQFNYSNIGISQEYLNNLESLKKLIIIKEKLMINPN